MSSHDAEHNPATPKLYIWNGDLLFLGTSRLSHRAHRIVQEKLFVCLEGSFSLRSPDGSRIRTRSCLLRNGLMLDKTLLEGRDTIVAVYYLAPFSQDYPALASIMTEAASGLLYDHPQEDALIQQMLALRDGPDCSPQDARQLVRDLMLPSNVANRVFQEFDPRALEVVRRIQTSLSENLSLSDLAASVHLSDSRLEKLFKDQSGLPITQHRLQQRVFWSVVMLALGFSVTDAALITGFSNAAHFSRSFRAINGLTPSTPFMKPPFLKTFVDEALVKRVELITHRQLAS